MTLTWRTAEELAAAHMRSLGLSDAQTTRSSGDGGLDVVSEVGAAQVKFQAAPVGAPVIQQLRGAAADLSIRLFYAYSGYTRAAIAEADRTEVGLYVFDDAGQVYPVNSVARQLPAVLYEWFSQDDYSRLQQTTELRINGWLRLLRRLNNGSLQRFDSAEPPITEYRLSFAVTNLSNLQHVIFDGRSEVDRLYDLRSTLSEGQRVALAQGGWMKWVSTKHEDTRTLANELRGVESEIIACADDVEALEAMFLEECSQYRERLPDLYAEVPSPLPRLIQPDPQLSVEH